MHNFQIKFFGFIICGLIFFSAKSQTVEQTISFADSLVKQGNYTLAVKNYKRAFFFSGAKEQESLYQKIGDCLFFQKNYIEAVKYYDKAISYTFDENISDEISLKKSYCYIFSENYLNAQTELLALLQKNDTFLRKRINLTLAVAYFGNNDFENSRTTFKKCVSKTDSVSIKSIDSVFGKVNKLKKNNSFVPMIFSAVLPGSGQLVSGDYRNATNAFLLSAIIALTALKAASIYSSADALITIAPWFIRYYKGNIKAAKKSSENKRLKKKNLYFNQILDIVSKSVK